MVDGRKAAALTCALLTLALTPAARAQNPEGCQAFPPSSTDCTYTATEHGGIGGYGAEPGGWKVTIVRKTERIVVSSLGGFETYACGAIAPGDKVTATAREGSGVTVGNPGFCL
jgi:hypothetical protein